MKFEQVTIEENEGRSYDAWGEIYIDADAIVTIECDFPYVNTAIDIDRATSKVTLTNGQTYRVLGDFEEVAEKVGLA